MDGFFAQIPLSMLLGFAIIVVVITLLVISDFRHRRHRDELRRVNNELMEAKAKLEDLSHFKSHLLSLASHQIRSPLAAIKGYLSLISEGLYGPVNDKVKEALEKAKFSVDELINSLGILLDLRKVEEGKMDYRFEKIEFVELVREVVEGLRSLAIKKNLALTYTTSLPKMVLEADPAKVKYVVQNLVDNAIKYTASGFVKVDLKNENGKIVFSVTDSGVGISPDIRPYLFEEFFRDERVKKEVKGTGLGLYIAKKIVEAHGGKIGVESSGGGKGSKFFAEFKAADH